MRENSLALLLAACTAINLLGIPATSLNLPPPRHSWGIRSNNIFKLAWYDPEHAVYLIPSRIDKDP
jgi:hypothetical protein